MWKYILIIVFVLLSIREINLMNQSLYITPDNRLVSEDKTTASELKKLIHKLKSNEFLLDEPEAVTEKNSSVTDTQQQEKREKEINTSIETVSSVYLHEHERGEDKNRSQIATPKITPPSLPEQNRTQTPLLQPKSQIAASLPAIPTPAPVAQKPLRPKLEKKPLLQSGQNKKPTPKQTDTERLYPENFKTAEERVKAILEQMRKGH